MSWAVPIKDEDLLCSGSTVSALSRYDESHVDFAYYDVPVGGPGKFGSFYWEVTFEVKNKLFPPWIGVATEQHIKKSKIDRSTLRGLMYSGNLHDGVRRLCPQFGERIKDGDRIGILLKLTENELFMYIFQNGHSLGLAFHINNPPKDALFLIVGLFKPAKATVSQPVQQPTQLQRNVPVTKKVGEGLWELREFEVNGLVDKDSHKWCCYLTISPHDRVFGPSCEKLSNVYRFKFHLVNLYFGNVTRGQSSWTLAQPLERGCVCDAAMDEPSELNIRKLAEKLTDVQVDGHQLTLVGSNGVKAKFERFEEPVCYPVTQNIFELENRPSQFSHS